MHYPIGILTKNARKTSKKLPQTVAEHWQTLRLIGLNASCCGIIGNGHGARFGVGHTSFVNFNFKLYHLPPPRA